MDAGFHASGSVSQLTAIGHLAGYRSTSGYSVVIGRNAKEETGGYGWTHVGNNVGTSQNVGSGNTKNSSFGYLQDTTITGTNNTMIGVDKPR